MSTMPRKAAIRKTFEFASSTSTDRTRPCTACRAVLNHRNWFLIAVNNFVDTIIAVKAFGTFFFGNFNKRSAQNSVSLSRWPAAWIARIISSLVCGIKMCNYKSFKVISFYHRLADQHFNVVRLPKLIWTFTKSSRPSSPSLSIQGSATYRKIMWRRSTAPNFAVLSSVSPFRSLNLYNRITIW